MRIGILGSGLMGGKLGSCSPGPATRSSSVTHAAITS